MTDFKDEMMKAFQQQAAHIRALEEKLQNLSSQPTVINNNKPSLKQIKTNIVHVSGVATSRFDL